ncbi:GntR family transcriptional regulator [Geomicrobium sp. JCM 19038]|uniref:GntR family transcriptional regulator n=1 Tax=Geomicrobium sp. JCM 19038 TaxID=1460635 RepID=UPI00045F2514|nr:GntR family transcriptional regulator [Geomicrobium sp. JCM 19038]GAK08332.1 transcriptional regulator, GntR family [Geomicrobium sp. JCM 19038]
MTHLTFPRKTLGTEIYRYLYNEVITLKYKPGQMISENELAQQLGVSRTPIREAIRLLSSEGFLRVIPQKGIQVEYISLNKVKEAFQVRESLERTAFRQVAESWNHEAEEAIHHKTAVLDVIKQQKEAANDGDLEQFYHYDEVFHDKILGMCGNETLSAYVRQVRGHVNRMRYLEFYETQETDRIIEDHEQMLKLIECNDAAALDKKLTEHLHNVWSFYDYIFERYPEYFSSRQ